MRRCEYRRDPLGPVPCGACCGHQQVPNRRDVGAHRNGFAGTWIGFLGVEHGGELRLPAGAGVRVELGVERH